MSFLARLAAIGRGSVDRALSRAEVAVGLKQAVPNLHSEPPPHPLGNGVPYLMPGEAGMDWAAYGAELIKASNVQLIDEESSKPARDPKALTSDPFMLLQQMGYKERLHGTAFVILDQVVQRTPIIQAIIQTRANQVARHCRVKRDSYSMGMRVKHRHSKKNLTKAARAQAEAIERAIMKTSFGDVGVATDNFEKFSRKLIRDSLTYDQMCAEIIPSRRGKPHSWHAVDAKTIRLADTRDRFLDAKSNESIRTVQVLDGQIIHEWPAAELAFDVRNPKSSIQSQGYGTVEAEMLLHVITSFLWAFQYNSKFFSQGSAPKGLLNFKGQLPGRQLAAFRHFFYQMIAGVENAWRTPILNAEQGVEWVNMQSSNRDMEYSVWVDFLIKLATSVYQIDPLEVNFKYGNEGDRSMFESANEQKVTQSKDKGLKPLLAFYANFLNTWIVQPTDPDFELEFLGLDALTPKEQSELNEVRGRTYMMIDELREEEGRRPLKDDLGQVINSPTWMQFRQSKDQPPAGADGGPGGAPPGDEQPDQGGQPEGEPAPGAKQPKNLEELLGSMDVKKALDSYEL